MGIYLDRPTLFWGGLFCIVIAALIGSLMRKTIGGILAGVFGVVGAVAIIGSFGGRNATTLQFFLVCVVFVLAGLAVAKSGGLPAKVAGYGVSLVAAIAFLNSSVVNVGVPFLDKDFARGVSAAFRETGRQLERIFDEASNKPNRNEKREKNRSEQRDR